MQKFSVVSWSYFIGAGFFYACHGYALALPAQPSTASGAADIGSTGKTMAITQAGPRLVMNWNSFNIGSGESVSFIQPSAKAIALNRVTGADGSRILGSLTANGQVFLSNPNGILFGPSAQVNTAGLVATTGSISDADFIAGRYRFDSNGKPSAILNQGKLTAAERGYIALLAPQVINEGVISARLGSALLAAGDQVTLNLNDGSLLGYTIDRGAVNTLVDNRNLVEANGGHVFLATRAANQLAQAVVNNDGVVEAQTVGDTSGEIRLMGDMQNGSVTGNGRLDASASGGGNGGTIETSAARVSLGPRMTVTTAAPLGRAGSWLIDPTDYLLDYNFFTDTGSGKAVMEALKSTDVTISTLGSGTGQGVITVDGTISIGYSHTLALIAATDIVLKPGTQLSLDRNLDGGPRKTAGNLVLKAGFGGTGKGTLVIDDTAGISSQLIGDFGHINLYYNPASYTSAALPNQGNIRGGTLTNWYLVNSAQQLQAINADSGTLGARYALPIDIDVSATRTWNNGAGFIPIGSAVLPFTGQLDGMGHTITGLTVRNGGNAETGLFGYTRNARIGNLGLIDASVSGDSGSTGGLVGFGLATTISNSYISGSSSVSSVSGRTGGLAGHFNGVVERSYSDAVVKGGNITGGLIGLNAATVTQSYSTGSVTGLESVGGLAGANVGQLDDVYSTATVAGTDKVGGLVGSNSGLGANNSGLIRNAYAQNMVGGNGKVGGLVGSLTDQSVVDNLVWDNQLSALSNAFGENTISASSTSNVRSFDSTRMTGGIGAFSLNADTWFAYVGHTGPLLKSFLTPVSVSFPDTFRKRYDGQAVDLDAIVRNALNFTDPVNGGIVSADKILPGIVIGTSLTGSPKNTGVYAVDMSLWSNQKGYLITPTVSAQELSLVIDPQPLGLLATAVQKEYDGTTAAGSSVKSFGLLPGHTLRATQSLDDPNVNIGSKDLRAVSVDQAVAVFDGSTDVTANYQIQLSRPLLSADTRILPKRLTVTANNDTRPAGSAPYSGGNGYTVAGLAGSDGMDVLRNQVRYGGTSQGAASPGRYAITPGGLTARNYVLNYVDGVLTIGSPVGLGSIPVALAAAIEDGSAELDRIDDAEEAEFDSKALPHKQSLGTRKAFPYSGKDHTPLFNLIGSGLKMP